MAAQNLYQELRDILKEFKDFLNSDKFNVIKTAINSLAAMIPQINELITKLVELMDKLKTEINNLNVNNIPGLSDVSSFTEKIKSFLSAAEKLLPNESDTIADVLSVADVVTGLPSLEQLKTEILGLISDVTAKLNELKSSS